VVGGGGESQGQGNIFASFILLLYLAKVAKLEVARKSPGSRQEYTRKSCLNNCYRTRSK
jgi:hypothetical protein